MTFLDYAQSRRAELGRAPALLAVATMIAMLFAANTPLTPGMR